MKTTNQSRTEPKHSVLDAHKPVLTNAAAAQDQAKPRWAPIADLPGFKASAHHVDRLNANGVKVGIVNGVCCIKQEDVTRAVQLLAPATR